MAGPGTRQLTCAYCGQPFAAGPDARTPPRYCSRSHRQRAYEARQHDQQLATLTEQLRTLRSDNRWLRALLTEHGIDPDS